MLKLLQYCNYIIIVMQIKLLLLLLLSQEPQPINILVAFLNSTPRQSKSNASVVGKMQLEREYKKALLAFLKSNMVSLLRIFQEKGTIQEFSFTSRTLRVARSGS